MRLRTANALAPVKTKTCHGHPRENSLLFVYQGVCVVLEHVCVCVQVPLCKCLCACVCMCVCACCVPLPC